MIDQRAQPQFKGLYQGVTRQPATSSSPLQLREQINLYPSVGHSGAASRPGSFLRFWKDSVRYKVDGHTHFFTTTDGRRWVLVQREIPGYIEVLNADTGQAADITIQAGAIPYLSTGGGQNLRFLSLADTTFILNRDVVVSATEAAKPPLTAIYIVVRRVSSARQTYRLSRATGGVVTHGLGKDNSSTRAEVASAWANNIASQVANAWGITVGVVAQANHIIKITGPTAVLEEIQASNDWDESAILLIKGGVDSTSDLLSPFENGVVLKVFNSKSNVDTSYYARFDASVNAWIETSYLPADGPTATFDGGTMPIVLKQVGDTAFTLGPAEWVPRTRGDNGTNKLPHFVGRKINAIASWKGRLILASEDVLNLSKADDPFDFWKETGKEARPADALERPAEAEGMDNIEHVIPFGNKLVVSSKTVQMEVPGDKPLTADSMTIGVSTRYAMSASCDPSVVGSELYFAGTLDGRSALWEYAYNNDAANSTAEDLSKHVPGYVPGNIRRIVGAVQSGRVFVLPSSERTRVYHHTSFWKDMQRVQSAWAYSDIRGVDEILNAWVDDTELIVWCRRGTQLCLVAMATEPNALGDLSQAHADLMTPITPMTNAGVVSFPLPSILAGDPDVRILIPHEAGWYEYNPDATLSGPAPSQVFAGYPLTVTVEFQPFYWQDQDGAQATGRWQVQSMGLILASVADFRVRVKTRNRQDLVLDRTTRIIGQNFEKRQVTEGVHPVPINARGDQVSVLVTSTGTAPFLLTGYTLRGRYTNHFVG